MIVVCKKWHVAKRLLDRIRQVTNLPAIEYLFNEETRASRSGRHSGDTGKRTRHRRALMRMLFDYYETDRLIVCMDPGNLDLLAGFLRRPLDDQAAGVTCQFSDDYLIGHAMRVGLAGEQTPAETLERLLPTIRGDIVFESDRIRDSEFDNHFRSCDRSDEPRAIRTDREVP